MFERLAFTLAEVLITLGIIGVVAAITIPSLITKLENIKNSTITEEILTQQFIDKWNGELPKVMGDSGNIMDVTELIK